MIVFDIEDRINELFEEVYPYRRDGDPKFNKRGFKPIFSASLGFIVPDINIRKQIEARKYYKIDLNDFSEFATSERAKEPMLEQFTDNSLQIYSFPVGDKSGFITEHFGTQVRATPLDLVIARYQAGVSITIRIAYKDTVNGNWAESKNKRLEDFITLTYFPSDKSHSVERSRLLESDRYVISCPIPDSNEWRLMIADGVYSEYIYNKIMHSEEERAKFHLVENLMRLSSKNLPKYSAQIDIARFFFCLPQYVTSMNDFMYTEPFGVGSLLRNINIIKPQPPLREGQAREWVMNETSELNKFSCKFCGKLPTNTNRDCNIHKAKNSIASTPPSETGKFFIDLQIIHPHCLQSAFANKKLSGAIIWKLGNEIKPLDLYCYLYAKYGQPNGIQNFFRGDTSENLIHWEWSLVCEEGLVSIQGQNFRTEIHLIGKFEDLELSTDMFVRQVKSDFGNYGKKMSEVRKRLEKWDQFVNVYHLVHDAVISNIASLDRLDLNPPSDNLDNWSKNKSFDEHKKKWAEMSEKYNSAVGLVFGIRIMLPILAESFINLLLFFLSKPEIKSDVRTFDNVVRAQIDIRVKTLHLYCVGFDKSVNYSSQECKKFHTLMNERNDLLHGNVNIKKMSIGEVYFDGKVPLFLEYKNFWEKSIGVAMKSVKLETVHKDYETVKNFIEHILGYLTSDIRKKVEMVMESRQLGFNHSSNRIGLLFSDRMFDFRLVKR
uniref:Uncharacterized protein n=1 Tax=Candidatus Kentrum sp. LFY TaxID=2126342 RepID=A0A450WHJ1_9GAMM|nr:MAG: hypothetical protein BECKLFY1418C_GA0070996_102325 [Candidatus Kentron sp. LFY]